MYSLYVALTTTGCFKEMEAKTLSPKRANEMTLMEKRSNSSIVMMELMK